MKKKKNEEEKIIRENSIPSTEDLDRRPTCNDEELFADTEEKYSSEELIEMGETALLFAEIIYDNYCRNNQQH